MCLDSAEANKKGRRLDGNRGPIDGGTGWSRHKMHKTAVALALIKIVMGWGEAGGERTARADKGAVLGWGCTTNMANRPLTG